MNTFKKSIIGAMTLLMGVCLTACSDANEYEDAFTDNPSWVNGYTDSLKISHPETMANTQWVRGSGLKINAYGEEVQGNRQFNPGKHLKYGLNRKHDSNDQTYY